MAKGGFDGWIAGGGPEKLAEWTAAGRPLTRLAEKLGVSPGTLRAWRKRAGAGEKNGPQDGSGACEQIENALFLRARGGVTTLTKPIKCKVKRFDGNTGKCVNEEEVIRYASDQVYTPPDTTAIKFYLTNQAPAQWAEKAEPEQAATVEALLESGKAEL